MRVENSRKDLEMKEKAAADRLKEIEESMNPKKPPEQPKKPKPPTPDGKYYGFFKFFRPWTDFYVLYSNACFRRVIIIGQFFIGLGQ